MASQPDLIERLWSEVINVDPAGKWMKADGDEIERYREAIGKVRAKASAEDVGRFVRFIRYEASFTVISILEERRLPKIGIDGVITELRAFPKNKKAPRSVANYFTALDLNLWPKEEDSDWIADLGKDKQEDSPFGDTGPTVKRLLSSGATKEDLGEIAAWQHYVAVLKAHEFIQQSGHDEFEGLHEDFLSADPSGLEGRPGSWPVKTPSKSASKIEPLWKTRSGQALAFSPDSRRVAIAGASGPARIFDTKSGKELVVCDGVKAHISKLAFSPDGKLLAISETYHPCDVCDSATGKLVKKRAFPKPGDGWDEVGGIAFGPDGELIRAAWKNTIDIVEAKTFRLLEPLRPAGSTRSVDAITMTPDRRKLAAVWQPRKHDQHNVTMWSWPGREVLLRFQFKCDVLADIAFSPDGKLLAVTYDQFAEPESKCGVHLFDAVSGKLLQTWPGPRGRSLQFASNDFLFCSDDDHIWAADLKSLDRTGKLRVCTSNQSIYEMAISPCFKYLATAGSSGAAVWDVKALLAAMGLCG